MASGFQVRRFVHAGWSNFFCGFFVGPTGDWWAFGGVLLTVWGELVRRALVAVSCYSEFANVGPEGGRCHVLGLFLGFNRALHVVGCGVFSVNEAQAGCRGGFVQFTFRGVPCFFVAWGFTF